MPTMSDSSSKNESVTVAIAGAAGRMGQRLCALAGETDGVTLSEAFEAPGHAALGQSADATGDVIVTDGFTGKARVLIDFTTPEATRAHVAVCGRLGVAAVIGTTGLSDADHAAIDAAAENVAIMQAPNMALGVNLLFTLAARAAKQLGEDYDIEEGQQAARTCALNLLAQLKVACNGDLNRMRRCIKLGVFVNCPAGFDRQPEVANGASDLMVEVFGDAGRHARFAVGAGSLPRNVAQITTSHKDLRNTMLRYARTATVGDSLRG